MMTFQSYITADGSVGLYNNEVKDIYHSATGALSEAFDKFIYPINFDLLLFENLVQPQTAMPPKANVYYMHRPMLQAPTA